MSCTKLTLIIYFLYKNIKTLLKRFFTSIPNNFKQIDLIRNSQRKIVVIQ